MGAKGAVGRRREPEGTALHRVRRSEWRTFEVGITGGERAMPGFCAREVAAFPRCGVLAHGYARGRCGACGRDDVVGFSCKRRGFCPSCGTRRMADTAAWLGDRVLPEVPVRQWVLSLSYRMRLLCAYDPVACAAVRNALVRAVSGYFERAARRRGRPAVRPNPSRVELQTAVRSTRCEVLRGGGRGPRYRPLLVHREGRGRGRDARER